MRTCNSMTFPWYPATFQDFWGNFHIPRLFHDFPWQQFCPGFSKLFHDGGNPDIIKLVISARSVNHLFFPFLDFLMYFKLDYHSFILKQSFVFLFLFKHIFVEIKNRVQSHKRDTVCPSNPFQFPPTIFHFLSLDKVTEEFIYLFSYLCVICVCSFTRCNLFIYFFFCVSFVYVHSPDGTDVSSKHNQATWTENFQVLWYEPESSGKEQPTLEHLVAC